MENTNQNCYKSLLDALIKRDDLLTQLKSLGYSPTIDELKVWYKNAVEFCETSILKGAWPEFHSFFDTLKYLEHYLSIVEEREQLLISDGHPPIERTNDLIQWLLSKKSFVTEQANLINEVYYHLNGEKYKIQLFEPQREEYEKFLGDFLMLYKNACSKLKPENDFTELTEYSIFFDRNLYRASLNTRVYLEDKTKAMLKKEADGDPFENCV